MEPSLRLSRAEELLQEAVYQSRAAQAAGVALRQPAAGSVGSCGLGEGAAVVLELSPRGAELYGELFGPDADRGRIRDTLREWVELQDALDRDRNHFLKAFRRAHGFDRNAYSSAERAEFERGLEALNTEVTRARRTAAARLLG